MAEFASKGLANGIGIPALVLGSLGFLQSGGLGGGLGGLLGGCNQAQMAGGAAALNALAEKDARIAELTANRYSDSQDAVLYQATRSENKTLRDELMGFITPLSNEAASNRERVAVLEAQQKCETEKALLREQLINAKIDNCCCEMNGKIDRVAQTAGCGISQLNNAVACINSTLSTITKQVIPTSAICPEVMPRYNSWTAPTTTATEPAA